MTGFDPDQLCPLLNIAQVGPRGRSMRSPQPRVEEQCRLPDSRMLMKATHYARESRRDSTTPADKRRLSTAVVPAAMQAFSHRKTLENHEVNESPAPDKREDG